MLAAIGIQDVDGLTRSNDSVQVARGRKSLRRLPQCLDISRYHTAQCMSLDPVRIAAQVVPHGQLLEIEHADRSAFDHAPARQWLDAFLHRFQIAGIAVRVIGIERMFGTGRKTKFELAFQHFRQAMIGKNIIFRSVNGKWGFNCFAIESHRHQQQWRENLLVGLRLLIPPEKTECRKERADPMIGFGLVSTAAQAEESRGELAIGEIGEDVAGLELRRAQTRDVRSLASSSASVSSEPRVGLKSVARLSASRISRGRPSNSRFQGKVILLPSQTRRFHRSPAGG